MSRPKRRPTHPGAILREDILPAAGINQTKLAKMLGTSRRSISQLIREQKPVSTDMAHRLARVFNTTPQFWLNLQQNVDLWDTFERNRVQYHKLKPLLAS